MTDTLTPSISFRYFFEEFLNDKPVAYTTEEGGVGNVLEDVASMLFQTISKQKVEFEFTSKQDFVNKGICMLCDIKYL